MIDHMFWPLVLTTVDPIAVSMFKRALISIDSNGPANVSVFILLISSTRITFICAKLNKEDCGNSALRR